MKNIYAFNYQQFAIINSGWSFEAEVNYKIMPAQPGGDYGMMSGNLTFSETLHWGFDFMKWKEEALNPDAGFITESGSMLFQVEILPKTVEKGTRINTKGKAIVFKSEYSITKKDNESWINSCFC